MVMATVVVCVVLVVNTRELFEMIVVAIVGLGFPLFDWCFFQCATFYLGNSNALSSASLL